MLYARDFRQIAREGLQDRWLLAVGTGLVAGIMGGIAPGHGRGITYYLPESEHVIPQLRTTLFLLFVVVFIYMAVTFVIGGAVSMGHAKFNLALVDGENAEFGDLFSQFHRIGAGFVLMLWQALYILLWTLLFIIPGILATYSYSMSYYIMLEHPEYGAREAISCSKQMMKGNRWRLFCLQCSFIGWYLLSLLTLGIGALWVGAYMSAAMAAFYRDVSETAPERGQDSWQM